jgi:hypothetical protein
MREDSQPAAFRAAVSLSSATRARRLQDLARQDCRRTRWIEQESEEPVSVLAARRDLSTNRITPPCLPRRSSRLDIPHELPYTPLVIPQRRTHGGTPLGYPPGHARSHGPQDAGADGAAARLRNRSPDRAGRSAGGHRQSGDDLPVPGAAPAEALDLRQVGNIREQPQSEVLRDYQSRPRAAQGRDRELGTHLRRHRPRAAAGRGLVRRSLGEGGSLGGGGAALATFEDGYDANCIVDAVLESHRRGGIWTKVTR